MATAYLRVQEIDDGLPQVCMKCGDPAVTYKRKSFSWYPPWVAVLILAGLLPFLIVMIVLTKRETVEVPLCDQHKSHWSFRAWIIWGSFLLLLLFGAGVFVALAVLSEQIQRNNMDAVTGFACMGAIAVGIAWLIAVAIVQNTAIRPTEITDRHIKLKNVAEEFIDAVDDERDRRRGRQRRPSRDYDDRSDQRDNYEAPRRRDEGEDRFYR